MKRLLAVAILVATVAGVGVTSQVDAAPCSGTVAWVTYGQQLTCQPKPGQPVHMRYLPSSWSLSAAHSFCTSIGGKYVATRYLGIANVCTDINPALIPGGASSSSSTSSTVVSTTTTTMATPSSTSTTSLPPTSTSTASTTISPTTIPPSTPTVQALPVGAALPSEATCASRVQPMTENRPNNATPNATRGNSPNDENPRVTGNYAGTTDEIIQWAACKWGINVDWVRAQAAVESWWQMEVVGDNGESFGLLQVRRPYHATAFENENARLSTAYNIDYAYSIWRRCFEGEYTWLNDFPRGGQYAAGDGLGCMGVWFSGRWRTAEALGYMNTVTNYHDTRVWAGANFPPATPRGPPPSTTTSSSTTSPATTTSTVTPLTTSTTLPPTSTTTPLTTTSSSTTSSTLPPTTTTTTTTTTLPATTTTSTTTVPATTTSTTTTTTTQPPAGTQFAADFTNPSDVGRFNFQLHTSSNGPPCSQNPDPNAGCVHLTPTIQGEHDMACGGVTTYRTITGNQYSGSPVTGLVYHCAPGSPSNGHMMTSIDTTGVAILGFSPPQAFNNITEVCWEQNENDLGQGKWVNVHIIPEATFQANGGVFHYVNGQGFGFDPSEIPAPNGALTVTYFRGSFQAYQGNGNGGTQVMWQGGPADMDPSAAPRYRICVLDIAGPNLRFTIARPSGTQVFDRVGTMPQGPVRVIWQDGSYNPAKHEGTGHLTWHFDGISIR